MLYYQTNRLYMFYEAYELFNEGKYQEALDMFNELSSSAETPSIKYWSLIFTARCKRSLGINGSIDELRSAIEIFPDRAEAICEMGHLFHSIGELREAERYMQMAYKCPKSHTCIRYEPEKYFEAPHEALIDICLKQNRYNDAEELTTSLLRIGREGMYDRKIAEYNNLYSRFYNNPGLEFIKTKSVDATDTLVIQLPEGYDGLGDNIVFSHIPRIAKETGRFKNVFISTLAKYKFPGYLDIVWSTNPYVDGFIDEPGTYTSKVQINRVMDKWHDIVPSINIMDMIMYLHNLDDGKRGHVPECHYKPNVIDEFSGKTVLDLGAKSLNLEGLNLDALIEELDKNGIKPDILIQNDASNKISNIDTIWPSTIQQWADIMYSAGNYICFNSGGYWLSGALGIKSTHIWIKGKTIPSWSFLNHNNLFVEKSTIFQ